MCNNRVLQFRKYKYNTFYARPYGPISHFKCFYIYKELREYKSTIFYRFLTIICILPIVVHVIVHKKMLASIHVVYQ